MYFMYIYVYINISYMHWIMAMALSIQNDDGWQNESKTPGAHKMRRAYCTNNTPTTQQTHFAMSSVNPAVYHCGSDKPQKKNWILQCMTHIYKYIVVYIFGDNVCPPRMSSYGWTICNCICLRPRPTTYANNGMTSDADVGWRERERDDRFN